MWQATKKGFTLIELMVVISIIVILVAILYPAVASAIASARAAQVGARISELGNGCTLYHGETNYYPGQSTSNMIELGHNTTGAKGTTTGSQLLAEALFLDFSEMTAGAAWDGGNGSTNLTLAGTATTNRSSWHWKSNYAPLNYSSSVRSDLMTSAPSDPNVATKPYCIADQFSTNYLPILYYPADLSQAGLAQFQENDNSIYYNFPGSTVFALTTNKAPLPNYGWLSPNGGTSPDFGTFISDVRYGSGNTPYHSGEFLLIGAGRDRIYGSSYTLRNWSN